jgi:hypothetical protein
VGCWHHKGSPCQSPSEPVGNPTSTSAGFAAADLALGSALGGLADPNYKPPLPEATGKPVPGQTANPLAALKKAAIEAAARREAEAGEGVDIPDGWSVPRYAGQPVAVKRNVPKKANVTADEMMKVDPRGRSSCTSNVWWPLPKGAAESVVRQGVGGEDWRRTAQREGRRLNTGSRK